MDANVLRPPSHYTRSHSTCCSGSGSGLPLSHADPRGHCRRFNLQHTYLQFPGLRDELRPSPRSSMGPLTGRHAPAAAALCLRGLGLGAARHPLRLAGTFAADSAAASGGVGLPNPTPTAVTVRAVSIGPSSSSASFSAGSTVSTSASPPPPSSSLVKIPSLHADDIRHPLDRQNTALLRAIPGLNDLARLLLGPVQEQILVLENLGSGLHVTPQQLPALHALMAEAAELLEMPAPDLYVRQSASPNAYTLAVSGRAPFVVVHTALVDLLTPRELQAVLAHELGHLKCEHGVWLTLANLIALGAYSLPGLGAVIAQGLEEQLMRWLRAAELTCDRAALVVAQDPRVVVSVLMKLAGGSLSLAHELNVDAFLRQARSYDEAASSSPLGWYLRNAQTRQLSHPLPVLRAREIDRWARSAEFKGLLERGRVSQQLQQQKDARRELTVQQQKQPEKQNDKQRAQQGQELAMSSMRLQSQKGSPVDSLQVSPKSARSRGY